ncbi:Fic family protein [Belliella kenyensis]|uniref:Fic family protein n=1 Tax=Belliella kenyensis TaxID=1472724 RepID=A0ABV8EP84_9BACT|nr:Fic family protein [Belliella kenyensis]MCH7403739.1 Fic family protein [Belliella kenyensis]MDN3602471.1 Fic family protein [Belliella kenyensis]
MVKYIYEYKDWTNFSWDDKAINQVFGEARLLQGKIIGKMNSIGFSTKEETNLANLTLDVVKSSEIEGEILNYEQVRSSVARRLGINTAGLVPSNRHIEGVVEMMLDATQRYDSPLTESRLFGWHAALFPTGFSGPYQIEVGQYRTGEMQIVSGAKGKEKVHFEAVKASLVKTEMDKLLDWINNNHMLDPVLKASIAHLWFIIIHPFDDGNGRIARAISDLLLARAEGSAERFYSMSNQILKERNRYYEVLQKVQHSSSDITEWLDWFLHCLKNAIHATEETTTNIMKKAAFWKLHENTPVNERQRLVLNKLFDGFEGKLKTSKWAKINKVSTDTALRDIKDLVDKKILQQTSDKGRNANYELTEINLD